MCFLVEFHITLHAWETKPHPTQHTVSYVRYEVAYERVDYIGKSWQPLTPLNFIFKSLKQNFIFQMSCTKKAPHSYWQTQKITEKVTGKEFFETSIVEAAV